MLTSTEIPEAIRLKVNAALAWLNATQAADFELTGLVDYETALENPNAERVELGLILCDGELCAREQVVVETSGDEVTVRLVDAAEREIPPLLDPPEGIRAGWLDAVLAKHEFVLLLFYRGLW